MVLHMTTIETTATESRTPDQAISDYVVNRHEQSVEEGRCDERHDVTMYLLDLANDCAFDPDESVFRRLLKMVRAIRDGDHLKKRGDAVDAWVAEVSAAEARNNARPKNS